MCGKNLNPLPDSSTCSFVVTEIIRWICIVIPVALSSWRYADLTEDVVIDSTFWAIVAGSLLGFSLVVYLPLKIAALCYRVKHNLLRDYRWRPAILAYILLSSLPSLGLILGAVEMKIDRENPNCTSDVVIPDVECTLDVQTATVLQVIILGIVVTEWLSKLREEYLSLDLITAMSYDFFFAYDSIHFITLAAYEEVVYQSNWIFICFVFTFIAMFRYVPAQPVSIQDKGSSIGTAVCIIVSLLSLEIPFLIFRLWLMISYVMHVSELIYVLKNIGMICFGCTQLYFIAVARNAANNKIKETTDTTDGNFAVPICRQPKCSGVWDLKRGNECIKMVDGKVINVCECEDPV